MENMVYAPILIPTLCRDQHFILAMESLRKNTWAQYTDVYIAVDYPKTEKHWDGYRKICEYLEKEDLTEFRKLVVVKREKNYGASNNLRALRESILNKYDRWIIAEDDIVFSPVFLEYMDKCLSKFEQDEQVLAVNGYSYPVPYVVDVGATVIKQSATFSMWGTGYWREKYLKARERLTSGYLYDEFERAKKNGVLNKLIRGRYYDYVEYALTKRSERYFCGISDMSMGIYMNLENMVVVTPVVTKTINVGFDGSGINCDNIKNKSNKHSQAYDYCNQPIDRSKAFEVIEDSKVHFGANRKLLDDFLYVTLLQKTRVLIFGAISLLFGRKSSAWVYQSLKKIKDKFHC